MRLINRIVLHCTSGWSTQSTASIKSHWKNNLGWKQVGYHILIHADGKIEYLAPISQVTNGVAGYNSDSVHICYVGGLISVENGKYTYGDTRTEAQKEAIYVAIKLVLDELKKVQNIGHLTIVGHRDLSKDLNNNGKIEQREWVKVCPTFSVFDEYGWIMGKKALERISKGRKYY